MTDAMRELIVEDPIHSQMRELAIEEGMRPLRDEALRLVARRHHDDSRDSPQRVPALGALTMPKFKYAGVTAEGQRQGRRRRPTTPTTPG